MFRLYIVLLISCVVVSCTNNASSKPKKPDPVYIGDYEKGSAVSADSTHSKLVVEDSDSLISTIAKDDQIKNEIISSTSNVDKEVSAEKRSGPKKKTVVKKGPSIYFDEPIYSFDTITAGDVIDHTFTFKNTGDQPLNLERVVPGCGCTLPTYPFISIAPGATNEIKVRYNSVSKKGAQKSVITVYSDDPKKAVYEIALEGFVKEKE